MVMVGFQGGSHMRDQENPEQALWDITVNTVEDSYKVPAVWILMPSTDGLLKFRFKGDMTSAEQVSQFIKDFYGNILKPTYKNQEFTSQTDGPLKVTPTPPHPLKPQTRT
jgi:hypothetical protein